MSLLHYDLLSVEFATCIWMLSSSGQMMSINMPVMVYTTGIGRCETLLQPKENKALLHGDTLLGSSHTGQKHQGRQSKSGMNTEVAYTEMCYQCP